MEYMNQMCIIEKEMTDSKLSNCYCIWPFKWNTFPATSILLQATFSLLVEENRNNRGKGVNVRMELRREQQMNSVEEHKVYHIQSKTMQRKQFLFFKAEIEIKLTTKQLVSLLEQTKKKECSL